MDKRRINFSQKGFTNNWLSFMKALEKNNLCCLDFLTQIFTTDSSTIDFSGLGTQISPLTAIAIISPDAGNSLSIHANGLFATAGSGGVPAGVTNDIQFNSAGAFGADSGVFTYDSGSRHLSTQDFNVNQNSLNYTDGTDTFSVTGGNLNYASGLDTFAIGGGNFNYASSTDHLRAGGLSFNYTSGTDHLDVGGSSFHYSNGVDIFNVSSGIGYANLTTSEGFSVSGGISYTHPAGANFAVSDLGQVSINLPSGSPTALLHIGPGASTPGGAPIKLINGVLLAIPENGAIEFDGTHFYGTIGSTRTPFDNYIVGSGLTLTANTINFGGTLTGIARLITAGNIIQFRDSTSDIGHNLSNTFTQASHILAGDSTNNFGSIIEMQDTTSSVIGLRFFNRILTAGALSVGMQMFNHSPNNPTIQFLSSGNMIIARDAGFSDDGTAIQIKGTTSTDSPLGIGVSGAGITAHLHISPGSAIAGSAPIKLSSGPVLTIPETGVFEFDGTHLYFTIGAVRTTLI